MKTTLTLTMVGKMLLLSLVMFTVIVSAGKPGIDRNRIEHRSAADAPLIELPYYGGARGQVLQIRRDPDGSVHSEVVRHSPAASESEQPLQPFAPSANELHRQNSFQQNLIEIQRAASQLVTLQQNVKLSGRLTDVDRRLYAENLEKLGISAQNLAHIQQAGGQDDFRLLFDGALFGAARRDDDNDGLEAVALAASDDNVGEETDGTTTTKPTKPSKPTRPDSVQVSVPDKEASVAEAKPVGLAIAGEGGVASSKPIATAVAGPGGLAVARPVATAIAGVSPSEVSALGIPVSNKFKSTSAFVQSAPLANVYNLASKKYGFAPGIGQGRDRFGVLVGPDYLPAATPDAEATATQADAEQNDAVEEDSEDVVAAAKRPTPRPAEKRIEKPAEQEDELTHRLTTQENDLAAALHGYPYAHVSDAHPFRFGGGNWPATSSDPFAHFNAHALQPQLAFDTYPGFYDQRSGAYGLPAHPQQFYGFPPVGSPIAAFPYHGHFN